MNVIEAIRIRKSVRCYLDEPVENEKLSRILEAARLAPSAFNKQRCRFVIVRDSQKRGKLTETAKVPLFAGKAPVIIVACAKTDSCKMRDGQPCYPIDVAIALDHITLAAVEYGLGSCWISCFDENKIKAILGIPVEIRVIALLLLGYPSDPSIVDKKRLSLDQIVKYEEW
ncbi:MAG: nitroreductase family protein [Candidatus Ranarchaeia archaeon]|jgi:nitroreductase